MFVRNQVVEITRLTDRSAWCYVNSKYMMAGLGTRKGVKRWGRTALGTQGFRG